MNLAVAQKLPDEQPLDAPCATPLVQGTELLSELQREAEVIERILLQVADHSSLSPELLRRAMELGVWYHFNPFRTTAVRVLDLPSSCRILEIGCGAGAVTRYLAEQGFRVTAIESTPELARCARLRCEGLRNVEIIESYLDAMTLDEKFDVVLCLDPTLLESEFYEPGLELFAVCRKLVKSTGSLILAVGNPISHVADARIELSRDHVRGRGAPLGSLRESLASAGFPQHETFISFPHHAAPQVLIEPLHIRTGKVNWLSMIQSTFKGSPRGLAQLERWWRTVHTEYLDSALAPGWVIVAHAHQVHAPLWSGWVLSEVAAVTEREGEGRSFTREGVLHAQVMIPDTGIVSQISSRCAPKVTAQQDMLDRIAASDNRIDEMSKQHRNLRSMVAHKRITARDKLRAERRARKNREAELNLVLDHSRAVGAQWSEIKQENAKLEECVLGLQERYELSEERLLELAAKVHEAELELRTVKSSWLWRMGSLLRNLWSR